MLKRKEKAKKRNGKANVNPAKVLESDLKVRARKMWSAGKGLCPQYYKDGKTANKPNSPVLSQGKRKLQDKE